MATTAAPQSPAAELPPLPASITASGLAPVPAPGDALDVDSCVATPPATAVARFALPESLHADAQPIFLSTATVELFSLKKLCTDAQPYTFLAQADLLADLYHRAAISDFHPVKPKLNAEGCPDLLLLVVDADWKYGQNYVLCLSQAAQDAFISEQKPRDVSDVETQGEQTSHPSSHAWVSWGTDKEMEEEAVRPSREKLFYMLSKKRRKFGQDLALKDYNRQFNTIDIRSTASLPGTLERLQIGVEVQVSQPMIDCATQMHWRRSVNSSIQYEPRVMNEAELESTSMSFEHSLRRSIMTAERSITEALIRNTLVDSFENDFDKLGDEETVLVQSANSSLQEYQSFTDLVYSKEKCISAAAWHPTQKGVLAVACILRSTFDERVERGFSTRSKQSILLIWSFYDPIHPQLILESSEDVASFAFHPQSPHIIVGGCVNGQLVLWDISEHQHKMSSKKREETEGNKTITVDVIKYTAVSSIEHSHKGTVTDVQWSSTDYANNGEPIKKEVSDTSVNQIISTGLDGNIMVWDLRYKRELRALHQTWRPVFKALVQSEDGAFEYGLMRLALRPGASTIFFGCAEDGEVITGDWRKALEGKAAADASEASSCVTMSSRVHFGGVTDLVRSPFFADILLSVGGWSCNIWKENCSVPLLSSPLCTARYTCGAWSPTRPGVFFVTRSDGIIDIWDIMDRSHQASQSQAISSVSLSAISVQTYYSKGHITHQFLAIGDDEGTAHVLEAPRNISRASRNEKSFVGKFFEREVKRIAFAAERRVFRAAQRQLNQNRASAAAQENDSKKSTQQGGKASDELSPEDEEKAYLEFEALVLEAMVTSKRQ